MAELGRALHERQMGSLWPPGASHRIELRPLHPCNYLRPHTEPSSHTQPGFRKLGPLCLRDRSPWPAQTCRSVDELDAQFYGQPKSSPAHPSSLAAPTLPQNFLQQQQAKAQLQQTISRLTDECWAKCVGNPGAPPPPPLVVLARRGTLLAQLPAQPAISPFPPQDRNPHHPPQAVHQAPAVHAAPSLRSVTGQRLRLHLPLVRRQLHVVERAGLHGQLRAPLPRVHAVCGERQRSSGWWWRRLQAAAGGAGVQATRRASSGVVRREGAGVHADDAAARAGLRVCKAPCSTTHAGSAVGVAADGTVLRKHAPPPPPPPAAASNRGLLLPTPHPSTAFRLPLHRSSTSSQRPTPASTATSEAPLQQLRRSHQPNRVQQQQQQQQRPAWRGTALATAEALAVAAELQRPLLGRCDVPARPTRAPAPLPGFLSSLGRLLPFTLAQ